MLFDTKREAARAMIEKCFSCIPLDLIEKAYFNGWDDYRFENITPLSEEEVEDSGLPMWSTLFLINDDVILSRVKEDLQAVKELGFLIYIDDEDRLYLGINGCGYDFYAEHWIPLYEWLGLSWDKETRKEEVAAAV